MLNREILADFGYEDAIIFENPDYDSAIIGISDDNRVIYDYDKMVEYLVDVEGMDAIDAADFIGYNTVRALPYAGELGPIIMYGLPEIAD